MGLYGWYEAIELRLAGIGFDYLLILVLDVHDVRHRSATLTALKLASRTDGFSLYGKHINQTNRDGDHHRQPFPVRLGPRMGEAKVADLLKAPGQNMLQVATYKLLGTHRHRLIPFRSRSLD